MYKNYCKQNEKRKKKKNAGSRTTMLCDVLWREHNTKYKTEAKDLAYSSNLLCECKYEYSRNKRLAVNLASYEHK